jgi:translation initiation factor IF-3
VDKELRINERIGARDVRLISSEGEQVGIKPVEEARRLAEEAGMDLVLVAPEADPPVCKIMDYGKYKYQLKKRHHEHHKHQSQIKELRLRPKTEEHDLMVRVRQAREFIQRGDRVLVNVIFRGREMTHTDLGRALLDRFAREVGDIAKIEKAPALESRRMSMIVARR